jgi:hypothetical protein
MRLYVVVKRTTARALRGNCPLYHAKSLMLDYAKEGTVEVPRLAFHNFPWLREPLDEDLSELWDQWEEVAIDFPDETARAYELPCSEGGNSVWYLPLDVVARLAAE